MHSPTTKLLLLCHVVFFPVCFHIHLFLSLFDGAFDGPTERQTKGGEQVVLIQDFITYLMDKDPEIKIEYLNFQGRNQVVYKL
jgi:hypothetical protein